ncbi:hypothetical protein RYH73_17010 [Olivibacter sp. CPCC 100613]|uniref:hypothetical protein n=1 Tax=Olivibacter sp. CPCC 100613 TaxID=3079931 RepID=UPI002FF5BD1E
MKKLIASCIALIFLGLGSLQAQNLFDKVDQALNKVDKASNTADKTKGTSDKVLGFFKKKENAEENFTSINITGINLSNLKKLNEQVETCKGVENTKMKFSPSGSVILVAYEGSAEDLLTAIQEKSKDIFNDEHIEGLDEHAITINLSKGK